MERVSQILESDLSITLFGLAIFALALASIR